MDQPAPAPAHGTAPLGTRAALSVLIVAWGAQAIVTQSLLLREALVLMAGSELVWGIVLCAWLVGVACGAFAGARLIASARGQRVATEALVIALLLLSAGACAELWLFRGARGWLGIGPGELLPLPQTAFAALLFVTPVSALVGAAFPLACAVSHADGRQVPVLLFGQVYALESLGSLIGGAVFSFWAVERLNPVQVTLFSGALTIACAAMVPGRRGSPLAAARAAHESSPPPRRRAAGAFVLLLLALVAVLAAVLVGERLNEWLVARRWKALDPEGELVAEAESRYQNLAVRRRAEQFTLYCDGHASGDFPDPYTYAPLAHFWLCQHPEPRRVLMLGGGAEGLLAEVLLHPVEAVDYVEPDARQIALLQPLLTEVDRSALRDPRVRVHTADARHFIKNHRGHYDLVIARLPEPLSALRARFYTAEFYAELRRAMTPRAVLCTTAMAAPTELAAASREYLASVRATLQTQFPQVAIGWDNPAQVLAATGPELIATDPNALVERYRARGVHSALFDPAWFTGATDWLDADKLARRAADLDATPQPHISRDLHPMTYLLRLVLWEAATSGRDTLTWLRRVRWRDVAGATGVLCVGVLLLTRWRRGPDTGWPAGALTVSLGTTGFVTMALSVVWLFAFQSLYGYVYQRIGWIVALFMAGLVIGCGVCARWGKRATLLPQGAAPQSQLRDDSRPQTWHTLAAVDALLALLALTAPALLRALGTLPSTAGALVGVEVSISIAVVLTGLLGGAAFALGGRLRLELDPHHGAAAGHVVGVDHAGACLGALCCGVLLVPVFGMVLTALLLGGMKALAAALLFAQRGARGVR